MPFTIKRISKEENNEVQKLVDECYKSIERKEFLIPWTTEERAQFFDEEYSYLYGAYIENKLVAMVQLFTPKSIEKEYYSILEIPEDQTICELGGALVYKEYRNLGIMSVLSKEALKLAFDLNYENIIITNHPENEVSNRIAKKLGFQLHSTITTQSGYLRNLYIKKIEN